MPKLTNADRCRKYRLNIVKDEVYMKGAAARQLKFRNNTKKNIKNLPEELQKVEVQKARDKNTLKSRIYRKKLKEEKKVINNKILDTQMDPGSIPGRTTFS